MILVRAPLFPIFCFAYPQWDDEIFIDDLRMTANIPIIIAFWNHIPSRRGIRSDSRKKVCLLYTFSHISLARTGSYTHPYTNNWQGKGLPLIYLRQQEVYLLILSLLLHNKTGVFLNKKERWDGRQTSHNVCPIKVKRSKVLCLPISHFVLILTIKNQLHTALSDKYKYS